MPGKHVRFAEMNLLYSPLPETPSPSHDTSSLPPCSPPPLKYVATPGESSPLELEPESIPAAAAAAASEIVPELNPILQFNLASPVIDYDISLPPTFIATPHHHLLPEPAVVPPCPALSLTLPDLPWPIVVSPYSPKPDAYVTVADVLSTLYRALRLAVHPDEYNSLPSHEDKHRVNAAYEQRFVRIADHVAHEEEKRKGVKRVDFLMGRTRFLGLSRTPAGPDVWALNVA